MSWLALLLVAGTTPWGGLGELPLAAITDSDLEVIQVSGNERLTWDQVATPGFDVATLSYVAFVDGAPTNVEDVACNPKPGAIGFVCSSRLPALTEGTHTIELAAYLYQSERLASPRSSPIRVRLGSAAEGLSRANFTSDSYATIDGIRLRAEVVATGLDDLTDLVALPDGRVLIAERAGHVRVFSKGALAPAPALTLTDARTDDAGGLIALAADREFEKTRAIFALYTTKAGLRLARFFESDNTLASRAILLDGLPVSVSQPRAALRMGPDGKLYLALDDAGTANSVGDLGSANGKVLRLNRDGTTPEDQPAGTPVFATGFSRPIAMDWAEDGSTLWMTGAEADGAQRLQSLVLDPHARRGALASSYTLPPGVGAPTLAIYSNDAIPAFRGNMFVTVEDSHSVLRLRFDSSGAITETEWLFRGQFDSIRVISTARDGSLYIGTADRLIRIVPER